MIRDMEDETYEMEDATNIVKLRAVGVGALITHGTFPSTCYLGRSLRLLEWGIP